MTATVLVVDDLDSNVKLLEAKLLAEYYTVFTANNRVSALKILAQNKIDIVLLDVMMPEMDGLELMRILRADDRYFRIPIIALTAKAMKEDRIICLEAGASDYLTKPIDVNRLLAMLRIWLYR